MNTSKVNNNLQEKEQNIINHLESEIKRFGLMRMEYTKEIQPERYYEYIEQGIMLEVMNKTDENVREYIIDNMEAYDNANKTEDYWKRVQELNMARMIFEEEAIKEFVEIPLI